MPTAGELRGLGDTTQRQIDRLGAPAGQHELGRGCPDEGCDGLAGLIKPRFGPLAEGVDRRRVARLVGEHTADGIGHTRSHGRGGVVIEINPHGVVSS